ncbi:hypothetical protein U3516DRAFT_520151, partial [Neocallimastix sp. 'constans']
PIPITNDIFIDRSNLNYNYTLNENIYNFTEGIFDSKNQSFISYGGGGNSHESIAITLTKIAKLLEDYTNTKKCLRAWEYWFNRWNHCKWYIQRQNHWLSKQKKAKQKLLWMIEENFRNVDGFIKKNNNYNPYEYNYNNNSSSSSSSPSSSSISSKYIYRMKSTRKIWIHQQQQMRRGKKTELYNKRLDKNNNNSHNNGRQMKKINKIIAKSTQSSSSSSSSKKEKSKTNQNSLSIKYNKEFKYYHHYIPETLKHMTSLNITVKYINLWLKLQEKIVIPNDDDKKNEKEKSSNKFSSSHHCKNESSSSTSKKCITKNRNSLKYSAFALLTTLMNRLQLYNSNLNSSDKNRLRDDIKSKEIRYKKLDELQLFDLEIENKLSYEVKRYLRGICIIELLLIKVNCFDDKLFIHLINFFKQFIDLSYLIPFMKAYIINSPNISSWCIGMAWEFFHSINEIKLFWTIIHRKKISKS